MGKKNERIPLEPEGGLPLADAHCHITWPLEGASKKGWDSQEAYDRFFKESGQIIVTSSVDWPTLKSMLDFLKDHDNIYLSAGWAPQTVTYTDPAQHEKMFNDWIEWMINNTEKYVSIGEIGLDFHHAKTLQKREKQIEIFTRILRETKHLDKPYVLHVRNASLRDKDPQHPDSSYNDPDGANKAILSILEHENIRPSRVMWHCFSGPREWGNILSDKGFYLSVITSSYGQKKWRRNTQEVPVENLLAETDAPFQHPYKYGALNYPENVKYALATIAFTHSLSQKETAELILENIRKFYGI